MQPPPQAAPSGPMRPPPVGGPRSLFWPSSPYRRPTLSSAPAAPVTCPPQPVTDPFAFSRQMAQDTNADTLPGSSLPCLPGALVLSQRGPLPSPHASAGGPAQAPRDPVPGPLQQPAVDTSLLASPLTLAAQPGPEASRSAEMRPSPAPDAPTPPDPPPYIPGVGRDSPQGAVPGPTRPLNRSSLHDGTGPVTTSSVFPQPPVQRPDPWAPGQGGPRASGHHYPPFPEGAGHGAVPWAPSLPRFPPQPDIQQSPGHEVQHKPLAPGPLAGDEKHKAACTRTGSHTAGHCDPEEFRQHPRASLAWGSQEVRPDPAQGHGPDHQQHCPPGLEAGPSAEAGPGTLAMFFRGGEAENEENLSPGSAFDGISVSSGHPPAHVGTGGLYQTSPQGSSSEHMQQVGDTLLARPQHGQPGAGSAAVGVWGAAAGPAAHRALSSQCENMEDLEFVQNQEVLPSEPLALTPSSSSDPFRYGAPPGPPAPSHTGGDTGGEGLNLEAPDTPSQPVRRDSVSSSFSSKGPRGLPSVARPQELVGTFIQQEVGKPEDDAAGSFFKQIDSSPVSGDTEESPVPQSYCPGHSQPATPSPPKPMGTFQTSANSSFEPVKSQFVEVRPVEADHANMVMEVKSGHGPLMKQGAGTTLPDASSPGNLEQPPDNMETLLPAPACPLPLGAAARASHVLPHAGGPPAEASVLSPEKRPLAKSHGAFKCESPVTTLWAQNELPDFGGNVLLAPASPALCVPTKPRASQALRPPEEGTCGRRSHKPGSESPLQSRDGLGPSENLENPPKAGEEEAVQSQASRSYASLLSLLPTESLHSQPVLVTLPDQSCHLAQAQPVHFPMSLLNRNEKTLAQRDPVVGERPALGGGTLGEPGDCLPSSESPPGALGRSPPPSSLPQTCPLGSDADVPAKRTAALRAQPPTPLVTAALESEKNLGSAPPAGSPSLASEPAGRPEETSALDFSLNRTLGNPSGTSSVSPPKSLDHLRQPGPGPHNPDCFYQQVTKEAQGQKGSERAQPEPGPPQQPALAPQAPRAALPEPSSSRSPPPSGQALSSAQPSINPADTGQPLQPWPQSSSVSVTSASSSQAAGRSEPQWPPPLPPDLSYYYYRSLYDTYPARYPAQYPPEPGAAHLYYQLSYAPSTGCEFESPCPVLSLVLGASYGQENVNGFVLSDGRGGPRGRAGGTDSGLVLLSAAEEVCVSEESVPWVCWDAYRSYDSTGTPACPEPERPSPRGGLYDRPVPRQGYPEGYYTTKGGWSSQSDYYTDYYNQYDFGDPGRWDRYHYGARYRDPHSYDRRHWYDAEYSSYRKEPYAYGDRLERDNDPWRYDPRFSASFDEDPELRRDPYGDEGDRRSVHSEHSARSLRSHCSSVSSHSQQSQIYRNHSVAAGPYDIPPPPESFHGDYSYGAYGSNFNGVQGYPEYGYPADPSWPAVDISAPSRPSSPEKFAVPHVCARFASGGQLIKVVPNLPSEGKPALVEVHSMETLLQHSPEQEEMRAFPGPLGKDDTHKVDVINFAQNKATKCFQNENIIDRESASLLWNLIVLLCRQNGTVVGTDIAELLLRDHRTVWLPGKSPNEANLIDFTNEALEQAEEESGEAQLSFLTDSQPAGTGDLVRETERFRELLLYGRKKDALESAMKNGLWGHALLLASKMDSRTHARVMTRFANSLPINDPLQTVYQLLSGRMPAASTCCGDEKWGDWRPHLAMVLSNLNNNMEVESRTMTTMGDTLASKGLLDAAHFCYLMAETGFGVYTKKTAKLVLIGSNHSLPFLQFATNEAIQRTEAYEYAQSLGAHSCSLPHFQVFKFIYACRLADMGLATQAFHYCEVIAKSILAQPSSHSSVLISQLVQVASQLRLFDPQLKEKPEEESFVEPTWLVQLQLVEKQIQEGVVVWRQDGALPQQCPSTPSSEVEPCDGPSPENPLLALSQPSAEILGSVQLLPSAPQTPPATLPGPARVPLFSVPPAPGPMEPGPSGPALSFSEASWPDPSTQYSAVPQGQHDQPVPRPYSSSALPAVPSDSVPTSAIGISTQESPLRSSHSEPREDEFGGSTANLDFMRPSQDPEPSPRWEHSDAGRTPDSEVKRPVKTARKEAKEPKKSSESWFSRWLPGKKRTEAHLPDDKNKSIVWDEKKNRWVNLNEPEEEKKAPPPPPMAFPKTPQVAPPGPGGPPKATVNVFSRKAAGSRARYVDVLNPGGTTRGEPTVPPTELFAPLAPLPIPAHLFVPGPDSEESQPTGAGDPGGHVPAVGQDRSEPALDTKVVNSAVPLVGSELGVATLPGGELSRCSSVSSLSREVCQHFDQVPSDTAPAGGPLGGAVPFYNPAQFAQVSAASGGSKLGRISQRKHLALS
ncbi:PREDICTED: protein transport protein Sec16A [Elephantulus edwardii]|uniref:protein transport protein Sec16A n=1 Tax=Elephantulus edwardii TaxID=28737 RepID=UPI0003F0909D|nr:PREDICTED: protein transport protein Sec16A [Elephantulus edwardii]